MRSEFWRRVHPYKLTPSTPTDTGEARRDPFGTAQRCELDFGRSAPCVQLTTRNEQWEIAAQLRLNRPNSAQFPIEIDSWYCPESHTTFSLLPDCLAARLPGTLAELEDAVAAVERSPSVAAAAALRAGRSEPPGAMRWLRRRIRL